MTTRLQELLGLATIVILVTTSLQLTGCSTGFNTWTPREPDYKLTRCLTNDRSCISSSSNNGENHGEGAK